MAYDSERAMFEAYSGHRWTSTGVIQWMLNNAWPSLIWHLYDYYLVPNGSYYGAKKANEPLHIQYSYDDRSVYVVNNTLSPVFDMEAEVEVLTPSHTSTFKSAVSLVTIPGNSATALMQIPEAAFHPTEPITFVRLELRKGGGVTASRNFYWVPARLTEFHWAKTDYTHTPALQHEDLSALRKLRKATLSANGSLHGREVLVNVKNTSAAIAFQVTLKLLDSDGNVVPGATWNENFIELTAQESVDFSLQLPTSLPSGACKVQVTSWNAETAQVLVPCGLPRGRSSDSRTTRKTTVLDPASLP